jgi:hypothetical protein
MATQCQKIIGSPLRHAIVETPHPHFDKGTSKVMKTSYYHRAKAIGVEGIISISRSTPFWMGKIPKYPTLAPGPWFKAVDRQEYEQLYTEILNSLDPQVVWDELHNLVFPNEPILLCWEALKKEDQFCHRRFVAAWFTEHLGVSLLEVQ